MVLFFMFMFSTVSIYRLPCKTISGLWFGLPAIGRARPVLCHTSREGVVSEGGAHGERVLRSDRPPGNAAPHHAAARAQMQPVSRSSRRWPGAPSSMPPSSPEEHLSPPRPHPLVEAATVPAQALPARGAPKGAAGPQGPGWHLLCPPLLLRGRSWTVLSGPKASRTTVKREFATPSEYSLFQRARAPARELQAAHARLRSASDSCSLRSTARLTSHAVVTIPLVSSIRLKLAETAKAKWPSHLMKTCRGGCDVPHASMGPWLCFSAHHRSHL